MRELTLFVLRRLLIWPVMINTTPLWCSSIVGFSASDHRGNYHCSANARCSKLRLLLWIIRGFIWGLWLSVQRFPLSCLAETAQELVNIQGQAGFFQIPADEFVGTNGGMGFGEMVESWWGLAWVGRSCWAWSMRYLAWVCIHRAITAQEPLIYRVSPGFVR